MTGAQLEGGTQVLLTSLRVWGADNRAGDLAPQVNATVYACGAPLLAALLLVARTRHCGWKLPVSLLALVPFQAWGICFNLAAAGGRGRRRADPGPNPLRTL